MHRGLSIEGVEMPALNAAQAASSHIDVSNAELIIGMFIPKLGLPFCLLEALLGLASVWAVSTARSHDPISWERATEKSRNI
jgi:hypothetical protein